ncbi:MAG: 50S ribosomal protein L18e [Candidatus Aenigmatarchaeota archaeon]
MPKPTGPTDPNLKNIIIEMKKTKERFFLVVAKHLEKPRRKKIGVNISKINKIAKENENIVIPGKVLSIGDIKKPVNVFAWSFSAKAKNKIEKAGGKCLSLMDLLKSREKARIII